MGFVIPAEFIIAETAHWIVNHRVDSNLPGYLMIGARQDTSRLENIPAEGLAELGPLMSATQKALTDLFHPDHLYIGRYGHMGGHSIHFHVIPIYPWVKETFLADSRYRVLESFDYPGASNTHPDGSQLTLYVWREFCESKTPPPIEGPSVTEVIQQLRDRHRTTGPN